jgi:hypothetical protein
MAAKKGGGIIEDSSRASEGGSHWATGAGKQHLRPNDDLRLAGPLFR